MCPLSATSPPKSFSFPSISSFCASSFAAAAAYCQDQTRCRRLTPLPSLAAAVASSRGSAAVASRRSLEPEGACGGGGALRCGRGAAEVRPRCGRGAAEVRPRSSREEAAPAPLRSSCPRPPPKARPAPRAPLRGAAAPEPRARQAGPEPRKGLVRVLSQQRLDVAWSQGQRRRAVRHRVLVLAEPRVAGGAVAVKHRPLGALCGHRHEGSAASAMAEPAERRGEMRAH